MHKQSIPGCLSPPTWPAYEARYFFAPRGITTNQLISGFASGNLVTVARAVL